MSPISPTARLSLSPRKSRQVPHDFTIDPGLGEQARRSSSDSDPSQVRRTPPFMNMRRLGAGLRRASE